MFRECQDNLWLNVFEDVKAIFGLMCFENVRTIFGQMFSKFRENP